MDRPPCWPNGHPCPNPCAQAHYDRTVYNRHHLPEPWAGWRMAGRDLVSPDGDRIAPERLRGLLWRQQTEARRDAARARRTAVTGDDLVTVVRIRQSDWQADRFGSRAG